MYKKRLKHRGMSMYRGPLSKMIDKEVEDRMSVLKKERESLPEGYEPISRNEAYKDNPELLDMADGDQNMYYRNKFGHVVSKDPIDDPSDPGIITTSLSEKEREEAYGQSSEAGGQKFWDVSLEVEAPDMPAQEKQEVNLNDAQVVRTGGKASKLQAFSEDNPHASNNMSSGDLTKARRWERLNNTQFKRSGSNRFGGGSGSTETEQQTLSDQYYNRGVKREEGISEKPPTNKLKYANPNHVLNKRTMSFRKKR